MPASYEMVNYTVSELSRWGVFAHANCLSQFLPRTNGFQTCDHAFRRLFPRASSPWYVCDFLSQKACLTITLLVASLEIDSKLDFGEDQPRPFLEPDGVAVLKNSDDIKVQCGGGGCNVTKNETNNDSISTDVLVHIKTRVQLGNASSNVNPTSSTPAPEDTPDVPVVVGYGGIPEDQRKPFDPLGPSEENKYNYNRPPLPPISDEEQKVNGVVAISTKEETLNDVRYKENGIPMHAPYYAQNPPQRYVWYPRNSGVYGSYDNRRVWTVGPPQSRSHVQLGNVEEKTCICRKIGNQWYPIESIQNRAAPTFHQPGSQINDKIEPLNWNTLFFVCGLTPKGGTNKIVQINAVCVWLMIGRLVLWLRSRSIDARNK